MKCITPMAISNDEIDDIKNTIKKFCEQWKAIPSLEQCMKPPTGKGSIDDIHSLNYIIYENLYSIFFKSETHFLHVASAVFGRCLVEILKFEWCWLPTSYEKTLGVYHADTGLRVPLEGMIIAKLSSDLQSDAFTALFIDIYLLKYAWPLGSHYLNESNLLIEEHEFEKKWGFLVPKDIKQLWFEMSLVDEEQLIKQFGLYAYDWSKLPDWRTVRMILTHIQNGFIESHGSDWQERIRLQNPNLFS